MLRQLRFLDTMGEEHNAGRTAGIFDVMVVVSAVV